MRRKAIDELDFFCKQATEYEIFLMRINVKTQKIAFFYMEEDLHVVYI